MANILYDETYDTLVGMEEGKRADPSRFAEKALRRALHQNRIDIEDTQRQIEVNEENLSRERHHLQDLMQARDSLEKAINDIS